MLPIRRWVVCLGAAALMCSQFPAFAQVPLKAFGDAQRTSLVQLAEKPVIDKSCIMMCDKWGDKGCLRWVMRCKGDPGYPKALSAAPSESAAQPNTTR